jgi:hypothetical protein
MTRRILVLLAGALLIGACSQKKTPPITEVKPTLPPGSTQPAASSSTTSNQSGSYEYMKGKSNSEYF